MDTNILEMTAADQLGGSCTTLLQRSHTVLPVEETNVPVPFNRGTMTVPAAGPEHPTPPLKRDLGQLLPMSEGSSYAWTGHTLSEQKLVAYTDPEVRE